MSHRGVKNYSVQTFTHKDSEPTVHTRGCWNTNRHTGTLDLYYPHLQLPPSVAASEDRRERLVSRRRSLLLTVIPNSTIKPPPPRQPPPPPFFHSETSSSNQFSICGCTCFFSPSALIVSQAPSPPRSLSPSSVQPRYLEEEDLPC